MAQDLQPLSQSQQLVSALRKKVRHAFSEEATDRLVSQSEFNTVFNKIFTGIPSEKFRQIFVTFDEQNTGTINWYTFLREEQLPKILLSLHDQSLSQITMLQQNTSSCSDALIPSDDDDRHNPAIVIPISSFATPHNTFATPTQSFDNAQSVDMTSLQHEHAESLQERDAQIQTLKHWITIKGLPLQESVSALREKITTASVREQTMAEEIKSMQELTESLQAQSVAMQQEHQQLETQHVALQNEHKYSKNVCCEMQRKYDHCLELYNKQNEQTTRLNLQITDLSKLKDQYEIVNNDQNNKIQQLKGERDDFREKVALLEMYCQDIAAENETLHQYLHNNIADSNAANEQSQESKQVSDSNAARHRTLSAVREDTESATPTLPKIDVSSPDTPEHLKFSNVTPRAKQHPSFHRSTSFNVHTFEQLTNKYSASPGGGRRGSILGMIRGTSAVSAVSSSGPTPPDDHKSAHGRTGSVVIHNRPDSGLTPQLSFNDSNTSCISPGFGGAYSTMFGGRRHKRKRTLSIISISSLYQHQHQTLRSAQFGNSLENMGDSMLSGLGDNDGYAEQAYEELGDMDDMDDVDQLQELTEQLRMELQEELEEELEAQIEGKYELKILKLNTAHNEQLSRLNREIERLQAMNSKQAQSRHGGADMAYNDDQKTSETGVRPQLGDDMDDFRSDETFDDDLKSESEGSYEDGLQSKMERLEVSGGEESESVPAYDMDVDHYVVVGYDDNSPLLDSEDKGNKNKKRKRKKDKKRERKVDRNMKRRGFCCSSIFADFGKPAVEISSSESSPEKAARSDKKKKRKRKQKKESKDKKSGKKKKKDKGDREKKKRSKSKKKHKNRSKKYADE